MATTIPAGDANKDIGLEERIALVVECICQLVPCIHHDERLRFLMARHVLSLCATMVPGCRSERAELRRRAHGCPACSALVLLPSAILGVIAESAAEKPSKAGAVALLAKVCAHG